MHGPINIRFLTKFGLCGQKHYSCTYIVFSMNLVNDLIIVLITGTFSTSNCAALYVTVLKPIQDYLCLSLCCHLWVSVRINAFTLPSPTNNICRLSWALVTRHRGNASKIGSPWFIAVWILEATDLMNVNPLQLLRFSTIFVSSKENEDFHVTTVSLEEAKLYTKLFAWKFIGPEYTVNCIEKLTVGCLTYSPPFYIVRILIIPLNSNNVKSFCLRCFIATEEHSFSWSFQLLARSSFW